jgi:hypothetical protein
MGNNINGAKYRDAPPRVVARALAREREVTPEGCWLWTGQVTKDGYGSITYGSRTRGKRVALYVHRLVYMHFRSDPGDEMQVDHLCHVPEKCPLRNDCPHRRCYNPAHLLAVTPAQNRRRCGKPVSRKPPRPRCNRGHEYTEANTRWHNGVRECRKCGSLRRVASRKAEAARYRARAEERRRGRCCETCGRDISHRKIGARYCEECAKEKKRRDARERERNRWRLQNWGTAADDGGKVAKLSEVP